MTEEKKPEPVVDAVIQPPAATEAPKPKKPRKPRKPKEPAQAAPAEEDEDEDEVKLPKHYVLQRGKTITLNGTDVKLRPLSPEQQKKFKVKSITGEVGKPCAQPVVLTFTSPNAAIDFFDLCLHSEEEVDEHIDCGSKTDWLSDDLLRGFA